MRRIQLTLLLGVILIWPLVIAALVISPSTGTNSVGTGSLRTSTGSLSFSCVGALTMTMNDYSFFPNLQAGTCTVTNLPIVEIAVADDGTTTARFGVNGGGTGNEVIRWRYITASDNPTIWVVNHKVTGAIIGVWTSDDPCTPDDVTPCVSSGNALHESRRYKPGDLGAISFQAADVVKAQATIGRKGYKLAHLNYRALQEKTNDDAPSPWIASNMKVNTSNGQLVCQTVC